MTILTKAFDKRIGGPAIMANETKIVVGGVTPTIPWRYARSQGMKPPYGMVGKPLRPRGPMKPSFFKKLQAAVQDIYQASLLYLFPPGVFLQHICVASVWRKNSDRHTQGRAIDIDSLWWRQVGVENSLADPINLVANEYPLAPTLYLSIDAIWRLHFGTVLGYYYPKHQCHWHLDDGTLVGVFKRDLDGQRRVKVLFMQAALRHLFGRKILQDGKWGPRTRATMALVLGVPHMEVEHGLLYGDLWKKFLVLCVLKRGIKARRM